MSWLKRRWRDVLCVVLPIVQPEYFRQHVDFKRACHYAKTYEWRPGVDYAWVCRYAMRKYRMAEATAATLDRKADAKVLCFVIMLVAAAATIWQPGVESWLLVPGLSLAGIASVLALTAKRVICQPEPPPIVNAVKYAEWGSTGSDNRGESAWAAKVHAATVGVNLVNEHKAIVLRWSCVAFAIGFILFVAGFIKIAL